MPKGLEKAAVGGIAVLTVTVTMAMMMVMMMAAATPIPVMMQRAIAAVPAKAKKAVLRVKARADLVPIPMARVQELAVRVGRKAADPFGPKRAFPKLNWAD